MVDPLGFRPVSGAYHRSASVDRKEASHYRSTYVGPVEVWEETAGTHLVQAGAYGRPGRNSSHSARVSVRFASAQARCAHVSGSMFQTAPWPLAFVIRRR